MANLHLSAIIYMCWSILPIRSMTVSTVELTKDGKVSDYTQLPKCDDGRIQLLSYKYKFMCGNNPCSNAQSELSVSAVANIHRMCSLKSKCSELGSTFVTNPDNSLIILNISYSCLGKFDKFVNICENDTFSSGKTIRLTSDQNAKCFEKCECSIRGRFQLTLADVRLRSATNPSHCSTAQLKVNFTNYKCDRMASTAGSVFNKVARGILTNVDITYITNSASDLPEMIYLTADPEVSGQTEVTCIHYPRIVTTTTMDTMQTEKEATGISILYREKEKSTSSASQSVAMVAVGVVITLAIVLVVVFLRRRRKQRGKGCRPKRLVETQLSQCQRLQKDSNTSGEYSFARDDETLVTGKGAGDYVDLAETHTGIKHCRDAKRLDECGAKANDMHRESNFVSTSKPKSTSEKLKKCLSRTPKQEKTVYSYATHQPLLRETVGVANDGTTTNPINQATSSRETHDGPFYFKLESQPEPGANTTVPSDDLKKGVNATSNVEISSKKKKGKQKDLDKGNSSTSRCNDTEANEVPHNAVPAVGVAKHQITKVKKTSPEQKLYANETQNIQSGDDKYETIDVNYSVAPESPNSKELRSPGVLQRILIKITKTSKQQAANEVTDAQNKPVRETEVGEHIPDWNYFSSTYNIDSTTEPQFKASCTQYEYATNQEIGLVEQSNDQIADSNKSKLKGFFGMKKVKNQNQGPNTTTIEETQKNAISSTLNKVETNAVIFKGKQDVTAADEGHYDKLNMGESIVPQHPNYDKVLMTKHGSSLKHKFKK